MADNPAAVPDKPIHQMTQAEIRALLKEKEKQDEKEDNQAISNIRDIVQGMIDRTGNDVITILKLAYPDLPFKEESQLINRYVDPNNPEVKWNNQGGFNKMPEDWKTLIRDTKEDDLEKFINAEWISKFPVKRENQRKKKQDELDKAKADLIEYHKSLNGQQN